MWCWKVLLIEGVNVRWVALACSAPHLRLKNTMTTRSLTLQYLQLNTRHTVHDFFSCWTRSEMCAQLSRSTPNCPRCRTSTTWTWVSTIPLPLSNNRTHHLLIIITEPAPNSYFIDKGIGFGHDNYHYYYYHHNRNLCSHLSVSRAFDCLIDFVFCNRCT
jgi:hypothetical protein